jgi:hypothetical protein
MALKLGRRIIDCLNMLKILKASVICERLDKLNDEIRFSKK